VVVNEKKPMREGALHLLTGVLKAKGPGDVHRQTILEGLAQPMGVWVKDGVIYLHEKGDLGTEIYTVTRSTGGQWKHELFAKGWGAEDGYLWHSWPGGLVFHQGYWHFNVTSFLATRYKQWVNNGTRWPPKERGAWFRLDPATKKYEIMATGMRTNESTWIGPWNGLFTVDVQGDWMPDNKVIQLQAGRFYGHTYGAVAPAEESPPMAYMPQSEASNSPGEGVYLKKGPFKGQVLVTEQTYGGINRYSIERINGELQACVFDFGGTPESAPYNGAYSQRIIMGPDGTTLFYGCAGGWWVVGPELGSIAKLELTGSKGFDILAIRSTGPTGFDVEFTATVNPALANLTGNYKVETYTRQPQEGYGAGARTGRRTLTVQTAKVSSSNDRLVHLEFKPGDLSTGTVRFEGKKLVGIGYTVTFDLKALRSSLGDSLFDTKAYYTLNQFGPGTVPAPGCMNAGDASFDALANDSSPELCADRPGDGISPQSAKNPGEIRTEGRMLRVRCAGPGLHTLKLYSSSGRLVLSVDRIRGESASIDVGKAGLYILRIEGPEGISARQLPLF
jgi:hypothetical protein